MISLAATYVPRSSGPQERTSPQLSSDRVRGARSNCGGIVPQRLRPQPGGLRPSCGLYFLRSLEIPLHIHPVSGMIPPRPQLATTVRATVLLVDDEEMLRRLLARTLAGAGFAVVEAANGEAALEAARNLDGKLSLVITDISMPVMDGLEFARAFRPLFPHVPILFMTGEEPMASLAVGSGVEENLLRKPFGPDLFLESVVEVMGRGAGKKTSA